MVLYPVSNIPMKFFILKRYTCTHLTASQSLYVWGSIMTCSQQLISSDTGTGSPRPNIFDWSKYVGDNANLSNCFNRYATEEMKYAFEMAGDYHKFILERHFRNNIWVSLLKKRYFPNQGDIIRNVFTLG